MLSGRTAKAVIAGLSLSVLVPAASAATPATSSNPSSSTSSTSGATFGIVDTRLIGASPLQADYALQQDQTLGVTAVRAQLNWAAVEPQKGEYRWSAFDQTVKAVAARHMRLLALISFTPAWARPAGCRDWRCAPADPSAFASFAATAAARYGSQVAAWEVWNEPNNHGFWLPAPDPAAYSTLLEDTAQAIRAADRGAYVVSGGLAPEVDNGSDVSPTTFVSDMCSAGALASVDAVGMHPYSYPALPNDPGAGNGWQQMVGAPVSVHSVMEGCGAGSVPVWITEYGAPTGGPGLASGGISAGRMATAWKSVPSDHVTPQMQAEMITQAVADVKSYGWVGAFFVYSAVDRGTLATSNQNYFGLRTYGGRAKPAWGALEYALTGHD